MDGIHKVSSFCEKHNVEMLVMKEIFVDPRKPRKKTNITNMNHYKEKLVRLVKFYPDDFNYGDTLVLEQHLDIHIDNICRDERLKNLKNIGDLFCLMVKTQKHISHPLIYRLLKLVLTLPIATASGEDIFLQ
ncbi:hypothetical protein AtNW77_Chr1g0042861 [Arabidopsis thaliana]